MKVGYARVSSKRQRLDLQYRALQAAGCDIIIAETVSSMEPNRKGLAAAMAMLGGSDTLFVWRLDRLGRDVFELMDIMSLMRRRGTKLQVLSGGASVIDIATREGQALYAIYAGLVGVETQARGDRSKAGQQAARARATYRGKQATAVAHTLRAAFNATQPRRSTRRQGGQ